MYEDELYHYGVGHKDGGNSGRYPWGSGDNPFQRDDFLQNVRNLKKQGFSEREIAEKMKIFTTDRQGNKVPSVSGLRIQISLAEDINRTALVEKVEALREQGKSLNQIAKELNLKNESSVRSLLNKESKARMQESLNTYELLKKEVDEKGMIYVGKGTNRELNISEDRLKTALYLMQLDGYELYGGGIPQVTNPGKQINGQILCPPGTEHKEIYNFDEIHNIRDYESHDGGETFDPKYVRPVPISRDRVLVRYPDEGGKALDGTIEIRRGVKDLDLRESSYAQVRILMDNDLYLKGMAIYGKDSEFPDGVDVIFNTSKPRGTPENKVFKEAKKEDPDNPFGALIKPGLYDPDNPGSEKKVGQGYYYDENGEKKLSPINKTREEGDWDEWKKTVPSQFLSKQSEELIKRQLSLSERQYDEQFEEIMRIDNPTVKKKMLLDFADTCDKAATTLAAASLPGQRYQVILPVNSLKDDEIYAPNWNQGDTLALIRYPHGGTFEIPIVKVNNNNPDGRRIIGAQGLDAVGINSHVAERLSGADFDGDTVMVIPCNSSKSKVKIISSKPLEGLEGFDNRLEYGGYDEKTNNFPLLKKENVQREMGQISNLITDMTIAGATDDELARAVRHSMVVIDANKHKLNYKQSYIDNGIDELRKEYMAHVDPETGKVSYGASTIISRAGAQKTVLKRQGSPKIDPETGELIWKTTDELEYMKRSVKKIKDKNGKTIDIKIVEKPATKTQQSNQMMEAKDAYELVSPLQNKKEMAYADYANYMKALANKARLESLEKNAGKQVYSPSAKKVYEEEFRSIDGKLATAEMNASREAKAQMIANSQINKLKMKYREDYGYDWDEYLSKKDLKKYSQMALSAARARVGADGKGSKINLTDKEWEAIQAGAITETKLRKIIDKMDKDELIQRATPQRESKGFTPAQINRMKAMLASGYTTAQVADAMNVSTTTIRNYVKGKV